MKRNCCIAILLFLMMLSMLAGCSGGGDPVASPPPQEPAARADAHNGTTGLWGSYEVSVDLNTGGVDLVKLREADLALNVLGFMEPPALLNMTIDFDSLQIDDVNEYIGVDVILKHPFVTPDAVFNGFDVKGIVFGPWLGNADGLTRYFNPDDFTGTPFGYQDGLLGAPDGYANYDKAYNGFKYFANGIGIDETVAEYYADPDNLANRGMFSEGGEITRHYDLYFGGDYSDFFVFNYAIFASYNWPEGDPPFSLEDFDVSTANQAEPVYADFVENSNTLYYNPETETGGGNIDLDITIFDWDKPVGPETVSIEAPGVIVSTPATFVMEEDANRRSYHVAAGGVPVTTTHLDIIVSVTTEKTYGACYFLDLMPSSHPLFDEPIVTQFVYAATVEEGAGNWPYVDPMDTTTEDQWTVQNLAYHTAPITWTQVGTEWQSNGGAGHSGYYANYMDTYLISPLITAPASGAVNMVITHAYYTENSYDYCHIRYRYEGGAWQQFAPGSTNLCGMSPGWPNWAIQTFETNLTPGQNFQVGFNFYSEYLVYTYPGWFIDHLVLTSNHTPTCGPVSGEPVISDFGVETYSVSANDPDGDNITYAWEMGDDVPPAYDDGPGNGDGTIDIDWQTNGLYIVDCKVTDDGDPNLLAVSSQPLSVSVHYDAPGQSCTYKDGAPEYVAYYGADSATAIWEDMCMMSDGYIIVQDQATTGLWRVPSYGSTAWTGTAITGYTGTNLITQLEADSSDSIAIAYDGSATIDIYNYSGATVSFAQSIAAPANVLAMAFDGSDNLWVLVDNANREMHRYNAGTFTHNTGSTFNTSTHVQGWVWDFVIDVYDGYFYILHEDNGTGITRGIVTKYNASGVYQTQLLNVFPYAIYDYQTVGELDPGEAEIMMDNSDSDYSSCRLVVISDYYDAAETHATQVVRLKALDLTEIGTPWHGYSWGATCGVVSSITDPGDPDFTGVIYAGESADDDYIDYYVLPGSGWW